MWNIATSLNQLEDKENFRKLTSIENGYSLFDANTSSLDITKTRTLIKQVGHNYRRGAAVLK